MTPLDTALAAARADAEREEGELEVMVAECEADSNLAYVVRSPRFRGLEVDSPPWDIPTIWLVRYQVSGGFTLVARGPLDQAIAEVAQVLRADEPGGGR